MTLAEALTAEIAHWVDRRKAANTVEDTTICNAVLGALNAVACNGQLEPPFVVTIPEREPDTPSRMWSDLEGRD